MHEFNMFEKLPLRRQAEVIAQNGTVLSQRRYGKWVVTLYDINNSFVEHWAGGDSQVYCTFKKPTDAMAVYEPYLV